MEKSDGGATSPLQHGVMCGLLSLFNKDDDWFLSRGLHFDYVLMEKAISSDFVKKWTGPKGSTYYTCYSLTPKGRLYLKRNT